MKRRGLVKALVAFALVLVVSPFAGSMAFADEGQQGKATANANATVSSTAVADPSSILHWQNLFNYDTKSVGRVWTDKTVSTSGITYRPSSDTESEITIAKKDNSEFLTALTALSSTSNLMSTTTTPLDIVLVLDTSTSMNEYIDGGTTKLAALKSAANQFVDEIAKQNESVSEANKQHRVAVVSFNASASTDQSMTECTGDKATEIKEKISSLENEHNHGTQSALGLKAAEEQLKSARTGAKQVVVFFTDGTPTTSGSFMPSIASPAVGTAKNMKGSGATVYTIGVLDGADPAADPTATGTSNENKFLHAVSSNYPEATYTGSGSSTASYTWYFGDRAKDSKGADATYYKSATNASELENIFKDISGEITQGASYPTETEEGKEGASGYITFDDQLGDYMQVTDLSTLVYNGKEYTGPTKTTSEDEEGKSVDTYKFSGKVDAGIDHDDLGDIIITVTHSTDAATGDKVQVKIPASLIPLRNITVDTTNNKMYTNSEMPVSVFYSSGLKPQVASLLADPDDTMKTYIKNNTDKDTGKVNFYANKWNGGTLGDVTAGFNPSTGNSYYYLTKDTPIFTDEACTQHASSVDDATKKYYYQHEYYANEGGAPVLKTESVEFPGSEAAKFKDAISTDSDGCFFKAGTAHLISINNLEQKKTDNATKTASDVLNPQWNKADKVSDAKTAIAHLGNNGKLSVEKPATLEVSKTVTVPEGYTLSDYTNTGFTFNISVPKAAGKSLKAKVINENGTVATEEFTLTFDDQGKANHSIKHGQTLRVFGLSAGWTYTVSEASLPSGFTQTASTGATGTFETGKTATASFTNKYSATGTLEGATNLKVQKNLEGRSWTEGDKFTFKIKAVTEGDPMPESSTVTVTSSDTSSFGNIAYTKPGTYTYQVTEEVPETKLGGVTYSQAVYQVVVTVTDNHDGTLKAESSMTQVADDSGTKVETAATSAMFTNSYAVEEVSYDASADLGLNKTLTGREWTNDDKFIFTITAEGDAPLPKDASGVDVSQVTVTKDNLEDGKAAISFGSATYTKPGTYEYEVTEKEAGHTHDGVAYSSNAAKFTVNVTDVDAQGAHTGKLVATATLDSGTATFNNVYSDEEATYDTAAAGIKKVLTGRDWKDGDSFTFKIAAVDGAPLPKDASGKDVSEVTVTKNNATNISFGKITFTPGMLGEGKSKVFTYTVTEQKGTAGGITYDEHAATIKVTVSDNGKGQLKASGQVEGGATFTNTYKADTGKNPVTITANKELTGRSMVAGEFSFGVKYAKGGDALLSATNDADGKVDLGSFNYSTDSLTQLVKDGNATKDGNVWAVNYIAYEKTDGLSDKGITPTTSSVAFTVKVTDNGDGTLYAAMGSPEKITFKNQYKAASAKVSLSGVKVLEHAAGLSPDSIAGKFTFTLSSDDANAPLPEKVTATNDANGNIAFDEIAFTSESLGGATSKTFTYSVKESGSAPGVANDTSVKTISIKVADDGNGKLTATPEGNPFKFTNTYSVDSVTASITDQVKVTKKLTGRDLTKGEFKFELLDADGNAVATGTNDADGKVELGSLTYTKPGEYHYTLREVNGGKTIDNVTYDSATYSVVAKVADDGKGKLGVDFLIGDLDGLTFSNTYVEPELDPAPTPEVDPNDPAGGEKVVTTTTTTTTTTTATTTVKTAKTGDSLACIAGVAMVVAIAAGAFALLARRFQR